MLSRLIRLTLVATMLLGAGAARAQGMLDKLDLATPKMSEHELERADIEAMIVKGGPLALRSKSLNHLDLSDLDLRGADLSWSRLNGADLQGTRLDGAVLDFVWAIDANLDGASLRGASLFQAQFIGASMKRADLTGARIVGDFSKAVLEGAVLADADMAADMRNQSMGLIHLVLRSARLAGADLRRAKMGRVDLEFAKLQGADLAGASLFRAKLGGADLTGAKVHRLDLTEADLDQARLVDVHGRDTIIGLDTARHIDRAVMQ